jgi:glycosyltransferase involved in cell wall biosynthesis
VVRFLFLSNYSNDKGATEVLTLAQRTRDLQGSIHYTLAGGIPDPAYFAELQRFVEREKLQGLVHLSGPVHGEEKNRLFTSSDVFLFPTSFRYETFGLVNLEAMAASLPVIASDLGGIPDVVSDGETGFVIPISRLDLWEEKIRLLASSRELRQRLGRAGRQRYDTQFTANVFRVRWEQMIAEISDDVGRGARAPLQTQRRER